jgi:hypothetical protein
MAGRKKRINIDGSEATQGGLFTALNEKKRWNPFPKILTTEEDFLRVLRESDGPLGHDYEFPPSYKATVIGISTLEEAVSVRCTPQLVQAVVDDCIRKNRPMVGHSVLGAERKVIEVMTGKKLPLEYFEDSMIYHHQLNADLCGAPGKEEDVEEKGSLGFMGLNTMSHMHTLLPAWKNCPGVDCTEEVCPRHNVWGYNAVDSYASVAGLHEMLEEMETYGIQRWYVREKHEIAEIALEMEERGIKVDREYVRIFGEKSEEEKEKLFPYEGEGNKRVFKILNPRSSQQVIAYFKERNVNLPNTDKKAVRNALETLAGKHGYDIETLEERIDTLPEVLKHLYHLDLYKTKGKGLDSWFDEKYLDKDGFLHPRFVTTGTATDRWSSSRPNLQNVPSRGAWGSLVKKAIIPRDPSLEIADADASQLEFRMILFQLGWDCADIPGNVFETLVSNAKGGFKYAADFAEKEERDIAKIVTYGSLYGQGMSLVNPEDIERGRIKQEIEYGARRVYLKSHGAAFDWTFRGKVVTFTGGAMSDSLFRDKSYEHRRQSLLLTEDVLCSTYDVRRWQYNVSQDIENKDYVQCPYTGKILRLYGTTEECLKSALSFLGQGCSAVSMQGITLRFKREMNVVPLIAVHDSFVTEFPKEWSDKKLREHLQFMFEGTHRIPGFFTPAGIKRGPNYGTLRKLKLG